MEKNFKEWKIEECIGEGAFGKVYKIVREEFGHTYNAALKVIEVPQNQAEFEAIRNEMANDQEVQNYFEGMVQDIIEEFTLMSRIKGNSNIVSYEDHSVVKKEDGYGWKIYIRMELLTGLFKHIKSVNLSNLDVIQLGIDICKALEVCWQYNIIHRDIKPENIFVSDVGTYKLGDFGIARELERTSAGLSKKGTRSYMAPEVYKGMEYNATVDIYSLGIVLYRFMNNNRLPFMPPVPQPIRYTDKEKADLLRMSGQPLPAPEKASDAFAKVIMKACAYLPQERYQSVSEMREELERIKELEPKKEILFHCEDSNSRKSLETEETQISATSLKDGNEQEETVFVTPQQNGFENKSYIQDEQEEGTVYMFHKDDVVNPYEEQREVKDMILPQEDFVEQDTVLEPLQQNIENLSVQQTRSKLSGKKKISIGVAVLFIIIGGILGTTMYRNKDVSDNPVESDTGFSTEEPTKEPTPKPTEKPTEKPTKKPKPTVVSKQTKKPIVSTKRPVPTKTTVRTKTPVVTKKPSKSEPDVFKERKESDDVFQER